MTLTAADCRAVLAEGSRSFNWASRLLSAQRRDDAAAVYTLCRTIDDIADEATDASAAAQELDAIAAELTGQSAARPLVSLYLEVARRRGMDVTPILQLIEGARSDLARVRIADDGELLRYCYRVAGTVGLVMCRVLGVDDERARPHAIDLGIAMQLTNICRDVAEDARLGRVYLPAERLRAVGVDPEELVQGRVSAASVTRVVGDILRLAEEYYRSADQGMRFIPVRPRFAILVASRVYREIGRVLWRSYRGNALHGRTVVSSVRKAWVSVVALGRGFFLPPPGSRAHRRELHRGLDGLPGCSPPALGPGS